MWIPLLGSVIWGCGAIGAIAVICAVSVPPLDPWEVHVSEMEAKLEAAWHAHHPGPPLPEPCDYGDEPRSGLLDIDDSPGNELVIASDRLGIAMFAETGELLALGEPRGCVSTPRREWWFNDSIQGEDRFRGVVVREEVRGCRMTTTARLYKRSGDTLRQVAHYREHDTLQCDWHGGFGTEIHRWATDVKVGPRWVTIKFSERCGGRDCETQDITEHDCSYGFNGWMTPSCRPLVE